MVRAFIMVKTETGASEGVVAAVRDLDLVEEAHIVAGDYDVIVEVNAPEIYEILHVASSSIQGIEGVASTKTYIGLD